MKKIFFLSLFLLCTAVSAWSYETETVTITCNETNTSPFTISAITSSYGQEGEQYWEVRNGSTLKLKANQGYYVTRVEFDVNGDNVENCDKLQHNTPRSWVRGSNDTNYYSVITFSNSESITKVTSIIVTYYHVCYGATHHESVRGTCTTKGTAEYWECVCGKNYSDADCTHEVTDKTSLATDIDPTNHSEVLEEHVAVEATCTKDGIVHYWHCNGCGKNFETKDAENEIADVKISKEQGRHLHPTYVEAKDATDTEIGYTMNHWHCQDCGKNFEDQECTKPITNDVIIPITGTLNYLCFTANAVGSTVELKKNGDAYNAILQYSTDYCKHWETVDFEVSSTTGTITLKKVNDKVYFRNTRQANEVSGFSKDYSFCFNNYQFVMSGSIAASGNVMSLVDKDVETTTIPNKYCFIRLFYECKALTSAPELPATTLAEGCYDSMFELCTSLKAAPALPATNLAGYCYSSMFEKCKNLTSAPELPATNLVENCYEYMFMNCTNLKSAPALPATTLKKRCYHSMFEACESLTAAPELPATTLCEDCYEWMFGYCTNLKSIKVGFTDWNNSVYIRDWLYRTADKGMFICPDELSARYDEYGIPCNWTRVFEIKANNEPKTENYYATFYSGTNAYEVPEGVTAYTGVVDGNVLRLTPVANGIIPADEAVILKTTQSQVYLPYTTETAIKSKDNKLLGTDEEMILGTNDYALSLGQNGVGFYLWDGKSIGANKAYLELSASSVKALAFEFEETTSIHGLTPALSEGEGAIYNLNGVRVDENYKGIVIKNGKKVLQK